jgi:hypothetical protein
MLTKGKKKGKHVLHGIINSADLLLLIGRFSAQVQ